MGDITSVDVVCLSVGERVCKFAFRETLGIE